MSDASTLDKAEILARYEQRPERSAKLAFGVVPAHRYYELRQARYLDLVPSVQELAASRKPLRILDIGSGTGSSKLFLDHAGVQAHWTAIEIDPERVALCQRLGYHRVVDDHDLEGASLPFEAESFDVVIASHILEHLRADAESLADWYRLLRPGGRLYVGVPMHLRLVAALARWRYRRVGRRPYGHCQFYSLPSLRRVLADYPVYDIRGFRLFSARKWLPLEDYSWFYRWSCKLGRRWPGLTQEVNVEIRKPEADSR